jgi:hypothetical protein
MKKIFIVFISFFFLFSISTIYLSQVSYSQGIQPNTEEIKPAKKKIKKTKKKSDGASCYQLGYRYGRCGTRSYLGLSCSPKDDIVIPERCRGLTTTHTGKNDGARSVR